MQRYIGLNTDRGQAEYFYARQRRRAMPVMTGATGVFTLTGQPGDTETVTIAHKVYTFQTTLTQVAGNVLIGATESDSLDNLIAAINGGAGVGTLYAPTARHPFVIAMAGAGDTVSVRAQVRGTGGNGIVTTDTVTNGSWGAGNLTGGLDS